MIADQNTVASIDDAESYLRIGHKGRQVNQAERVAWTTTRNLPTEDSQLAKVYMKATAELKDQRVKAPFYTVSVSFPETDAPKVDRAMMEKAADRVLKDLGLQEHEAIIVAHKDRGHPHFHILANRIHPETGRAWATWKDYEKTHLALRAFEKEHGLTQVSTWKVEPEKQQELPSLPRKSQEAFVEKIRAAGIAEDLKKSQSWAELEDRLGARGLVLQRSGRGLQLTDGESVAKISAIHRKSSLKNLESRFGETWKEWAGRSPETAVEPNARAGKNAPAAEVLDRIERAEPLIKIYRENELTDRTTKNLQTQIKASMDRKQTVDSDLQRVEHQLRTKLSSAVQGKPPTLSDLKPDPTTPAAAVDKQTNNPGSADKQTAPTPKQTKASAHEQLADMVKRKDIQSLQPQIDRYQQLLSRPPAPKSPSLQDFRRKVQEVIKEDRLHGKNRFFRGDDTDRSNAKTQVAELPELLQKREHLRTESAILKDRISGALQVKTAIAEKRRPEPTKVEIYKATRGLPAKAFSQMPKGAQQATRKVRSDTVKIWDAYGPHLANKGALMVMPKSLRPFATVALSKNKTKALGRVVGNAALKAVPKPLRPAVRVLQAGKQMADLAKMVLTRMMPPQVQVILVAIQLLQKILVAARAMAAKTLEQGQGR